MKKIWGEKGVMTSCNKQCRVKMYCELMSTVYSDSKKCQGLERYDFNNDFFHAFLDGLLTSPWYLPK